MSKVVHEHVYKPGFFGGVTLTTLCGRVDNSGTDYNVAVDGQPVTCKLCLSPLPRNLRWRGMTYEQAEAHFAMTRLPAGEGE